MPYFLGDALKKSVVETIFCTYVLEKEIFEENECVSTKILAH